MLSLSHILPCFVPLVVHHTWLAGQRPCLNQPPCGHLATDSAKQITGDGLVHLLAWLTVHGTVGMVFQVRVSVIPTGPQGFCNVSEREQVPHLSRQSQALPTMSQAVLHHQGCLDQLAWAPASTWLLHNWLPSVSENVVKTQTRVTPKPRGNFGFKTEQEDHSSLKIGRSLFFLLIYFSVTSALSTFSVYLHHIFQFSFQPGWVKAYYSQMNTGALK